MMADLNLTGWMESALCAQTSPEDFFPVQDLEQRGINNTAQAKATCRACGVITECLAYALAHNETWGIWGGTLPGERRRMKRERRAA